MEELTEDQIKANQEQKDYWDRNEGQAVTMAMNIEKAMGKGLWFDAKSLQHKTREKLKYGPHTINLLVEYGMIDTRLINKKECFQIILDEERRLTYYSTEQQRLLKLMSDANFKMQAIEEKKFKRVKGFMEIKPELKHMLFVDMEKESFNSKLECAFCMKEIDQEKVIPVRVFDPAKPDLEMRFHPACYNEQIINQTLTVPMSVVKDNASPSEEVVRSGSDQK
jgi:hypothetical protein